MKRGSFRYLLQLQTSTLPPRDGGTELTLHYSYQPNLLGRLTARLTDRLLRRGIGGLAKGLQIESERLDATRS